MASVLAPEQLFSATDERVLLDVRTPDEFVKGHIPGANNLPLFSNEERAEVGTLYKQKSPESAFLRGLDFAGAKMRYYVEEAQRLAPQKKVIVHCWRGGQRSSSIGWLLQNAGFDVVTLRGGYKAYRNYIHAHFFIPRHRYVILGGYTGSAKTEILREIAHQGDYFIDLEGIAHHKGSSFGALGEPSQPTVEQFENDLHQAFYAIPEGAKVWLEDESRSIGRVYIPEGFWLQMSRSPVVKLEVSKTRRLDHLVKVYAQFDKATLIAAFTRISKRLGGLNLQNALKALEVDDFYTAADIALTYYDKAYQVTLDRKTECPLIMNFPVENESFEVIASNLSALNIPTQTSIQVEHKQK